MVSKTAKPGQGQPGALPWMGNPWEKKTDLTGKALSPAERRRFPHLVIFPEFILPNVVFRQLFP